MTRGRAALVLGAVTLALTATACSLAWQEDSPLAAGEGGGVSGSAPGFLVLLTVAFAAYVAALPLLGRGAVPLAPVVVVAVVLQLSPLAAPLLLSSDAWTYWAYGRIAAHEGGNPYDDPPRAFPASPAFEAMGERWRDTTTVYGPAFTLASEPVALVAGTSETAAAWIYKALAGGVAVAAALLAALVARRRPLAAAFVGWNPLLAVHLAGGGHNDAWVGALLVAALALASVRRAQAAGAVWAVAVAVKWVPLVFLVLEVIRGRRGRPVGLLGLALGAATVALFASWRYGLHWLAAAAPLLENAAEETSYALPHRLEQLGLPDRVATAAAVTAFVAGFVLLLRRAAGGAAVLGRTAVLVLATTPYLAVWYLGWAVPLAAAEEDRWARLGTLAFGAYLLPQTIPL